MEESGKVEKTETETKTAALHALVHKALDQVQTVERDVRQALANQQQYLLAWQKQFEERAASQSRSIENVDREVCDARVELRELKQETTDNFKGRDLRREAIEKRLEELAGFNEELRTKVPATLAELEKLRDELGPTYGKKLEALGTQVAGLVTIGKRVASVEARCGGYDGTLTRVQLLLEELQKSTDRLLKEIGAAAGAAVPAEKDVEKTPT
jgi:DNA repair exonuclease SbcCD ATPase subunit